MEMFTQFLFHLNAGQGSVFYIWSFSCSIFNMSGCQKTVSESKCYLSTKIERLTLLSTLTSAKRITI